MSALRAAPAGPRALRGDGQKTGVVARDLFDAAARHRTELVHTPFYGVRCVTLQTSAPTRSIHANGGRAVFSRGNRWYSKGDLRIKVEPQRGTGGTATDAVRKPDRRPCFSPLALMRSCPE